MNTVDTLNSLSALISLPTMVMGFIYFGRRLEVLDYLKHEVDNTIKPDLRDLRERVIRIETRVDVLEQSVEDIKRVVYKPSPAAPSDT